MLCFAEGTRNRKVGSHQLNKDSSRSHCIMTLYLTRPDQLGSGDAREMGSLSRRVIISQALLEAFGNAATTNNHNSSRFGKFVRLLFDESGEVRGARISIYLLEKSRLTIQCKDERNFHVLYQASPPPSPHTCM